MADLKQQLQDLEDKHNREIQALKALILKEENQYGIGTYHFYKKRVLYRIMEFHGTNGDKPILMAINDGSGDLIKYDYSVSELKNFQGWSAATKEEVENKLKEKVIKKGYKSGVSLKYPWHPVDKRNNVYTPDFSGKTKYYPHDDSFEFNNVKVYKNGVWAEIVSVKEVIKIGEYEVEWINNNQILKVGCNEIPFETIINLRNLMERLGIESVKMGHAGEVVSLSTIQKLLNLTV